MAARTLGMVEAKNYILSDIFFIAEDISKGREMPRSTGRKSIQGCWSDSIETVNHELWIGDSRGIDRSRKSSLRDHNVLL